MKPLVDLRRKPQLTKFFSVSHFLSLSLPLLLSSSLCQSLSLFVNLYFVFPTQPASQLASRPALEAKILIASRNCVCRFFEQNDTFSSRNKIVHHFWTLSLLKLIVLLVSLTSYHA